MLELRTNLLENIAEEPREHYRFMLDVSKMGELRKKALRQIRTRFLVFILACGIITVYGVLYSTGVVGFGIGMLFAGVVGYIKTFSVYGKNWNGSLSIIKDSVYDYAVYDGYITISIDSKNAIRQVRIAENEIPKTEIVGVFVTFLHDGRLYCLSRDILAQDSFFLKKCAKK